MPKQFIYLKVDQELQCELEEVYGKERLRCRFLNQKPPTRGDFIASIVKEWITARKEKLNDN